MSRPATEPPWASFFRVWGVPFSVRRLGPHRAIGDKRVRMWVEGDPWRAFGDLRLADGLEIVVAYGAGSEAPDGD